MNSIHHLAPICLAFALLVGLSGGLQAQFTVQTNGNGTCTITNYAGSGVAVTNQLHSRLFGLGTISPYDTNAWLQIGKNYIITPKPSKGYVFTNWTVATNWLGGWSTNKPVLRFMMASNLTLTATFVATTKPAVPAHAQVIASPSVFVTDLRLTASGLLFNLQITGTASG